MTTLTNAIRRFHLNSAPERNELDAFITERFRLPESAPINRNDLMWFYLGLIARLNAPVNDVDCQEYSGAECGDYCIAYGHNGSRNSITIRETVETSTYCPNGTGRFRSMADFPICDYAEYVVLDDDAGFYFDRAEGYELSDTGEIISPMAFSAGDYFNCSGCDGYFTDDSRGADYDNVVCTNCEDTEKDCLHDYSANVLKVIDRCCVSDSGDFVSIANRLVFGVELETGTRRHNSTESIAETICNNGERFTEFAICKRDGTVSGPEIVTLPATLAAHSKILPWAQWLETLRAVATRGNDETGIHVHVNRRALSPLTCGKLLNFINNDRDARALWQRIAQRGENTWTKYRAKSWGEARGTNADRYEAINMTSETLEFRIFRSSLTVERVLKNIESVHAAIRYCQQASASNLSATDFLQFIKAKRADYPNLSVYAKSFTASLSV